MNFQGVTKTRTQVKSFGNGMDKLALLGICETWIKLDDEFSFFNP